MALQFLLSKKRIFFTMKFLTLILLLLCELSFAQESKTQPSYEYFKGKIDGKYAFTMILQSQSEKCGGYYSYDKYKQLLGLEGICDSEKLEVYETYYHNHQKDSKFTGTRKGEKIEGVWYSPKTKKSLSFSAIKIIPNRKTTLQQAKGVYYLDHIGGWCCANGMMDVYKENNAWKMTTSSISNGMREGSDFPLTKKQKNTFSTATLKVNDTLAVDLYANGKLIAHFPYTEKNTLDLKKPFESERYLDNQIAYFNADNFYQDQLRITATDKFNLQSYFLEDIWDVDDIVSIDYAPLQSIFSVTLGVGTNSATMTFVKKE